MRIPSFGKKEPGEQYQKRIGVYVVIPDEKTQEIVLVQAPNGAFFLPGGEMEGTETRLETLRRELLEELGYQALAPVYLGQADEYFFSRHRDTHFFNPGYFYAAAGFKREAAPLEDFNHILWFPIDEAIEKLKRGSHKWAVECWQKEYLNSK